jgi:hypothetical protein
MSSSKEFSRRALLLSGVLVGGAALAGCSQSWNKEPTGPFKLPPDSVFDELPERIPRIRSAVVVEASDDIGSGAFKDRRSGVLLKGGAITAMPSGKGCGSINVASNGDGPSSVRARQMIAPLDASHSLVRFTFNGAEPAGWTAPETSSRMERGKLLYGLPYQERRHPLASDPKLQTPAILGGVVLGEAGDGQVLLCLAKPYHRKGKAVLEDEGLGCGFYTNMAALDGIAVSSAQMTPKEIESEYGIVLDTPLTSLSTAVITIAHSRIVSGVDANATTTNCT